MLVVAFLFHGSVYLTLKTRPGELHDRVRKFAQTIGLVAIVGGAVYLVWRTWPTRPCSRVWPWSAGS